LRLLPVIPAVMHMWQSTINNLKFAFRAQWPWFAVLTVLFSVLALSNDLKITGDQAALEAELKNNPEKAAMFVFSVFAGVGAALLAFSSIAVSWHRYVLLDEVPQGLAALRVDSIVWRYLGNLMLLGVFMTVIALPLSLVPFPLMLSMPALAVGILMAYVIFVMMPILYRLSIKLPAIALDRRDFKMGDAWNVSRGNWGQLIGVALLYSGGSWVIGLVLVGIATLLNTVFGPIVGFWLDIAIQTVINWVVTVMGITLLTSLYGFFVEKRDF
jgi:hypothetical protein